MENYTIESWIHKKYYFDSSKNGVIIPPPYDDGSGGAGGGGTGGTGGTGDTGGTGGTSFLSTGDLILNLRASDTNSYPGTGLYWYDLTSYGNHGIFYNGAAITGTGNSKAFIFDGTDTYFNIGRNVTQNTASVSMSAWIKTTNSLVSGQMIFYNGSEARLNGYGFSINKEGVNSGNIYVRYGDSQWYNTGIAVSGSAWHYITVNILPDRTNQVFVNGAIGYTGTASRINTPTNYTEVGRSDFPVARYFYGHIAQVHVYKKALTTSEVQGNFNSTKTPYGY
jgi:hypothetical protein